MELNGILKLNDLHSKTQKNKKNKHLVLLKTVS